VVDPPGREHAKAGWGVGPGGQEGRSGGSSPAGRHLFRTTVIRKPRRGKWRLTLDTSNAGASRPRSPPPSPDSDLRLGLSATGITINARLTSHNRGLPRARITVVLRAATGGSTTRLTLHTIPRHPGRYTATLRNQHITTASALLAYAKTGSQTITTVNDIRRAASRDR